MIVKTDCETDGALHSTSTNLVVTWSPQQPPVSCADIRPGGRGVQGCGGPRAPGVQPEGGGRHLPGRDGGGGHAGAARAARHSSHQPQLLLSITID